jgi:ApbE superfamily uncharacterized protein (UPF0280 family)
MSGPRNTRGADGRLYLQHGPIELIIEVFGDRDEVGQAQAQAIAAFDGLLDGLVAELPLLRRPLGVAYPMLRGTIAQAMVRAAWPHRDEFITPMAAVAGAVADHMLAAAVKGRSLAKGYVNNGGDIALYLSPGASLDAGVVTDLAAIGLGGGLSGHVSLHHDLAVRGMATSGWQGRSHSRGIADAVTVLAATAAQADAAATMIANRVNIDHPAIERVPANSLDPDSDLGDLAVTIAVDVPSLGEGGRRAALLAGVDRARGLLAQGVIVAALLALGDQAASVGQLGGAALPRKGQRT